MMEGDEDRVPHLSGEKRYDGSKEGHIAPFLFISNSSGHPWSNCRPLQWMLCLGSWKAHAAGENCRSERLPNQCCQNAHEHSADPGSGTYQRTMCLRQ